MRIQALVGAEIVPVEIDDFEDLLLKACDRAGVAPPEALIERALGDEADENKEVTTRSEEDGSDNSGDNGGDNSGDKSTDDSRDTDEDLPDFPGYQDAISTMSDYGFDFMEAGGGRKEENVRDAWNIFSRKVKAGEIEPGE